MKSLTVCLSLIACSSFLSAAPVVKSGETIAFLGDSITQLGNDPSQGYIHLVIDGLKNAGVEATAIPAGISGHKSNNMLARVDKDVIQKKPQWMTLSCGVNDVWHGKNGVVPEDYKKNITEIVDKCDAAGIKVMILTATMISENPKAPNNIKLAGYNDFLRDLAKERKYLLADLNADMTAGVEKGQRFTYDGVHMAFAGNKMMASGILRAFGLTEDEIKVANERWNARPNTNKITFSTSEVQKKALNEKAQAAEMSVQEYIMSKLFD